MGEPSKGYQDFLKQLHAEGYERAQGFDPDLFSKINPGERAEVERILLDLFKNGDRRGMPLFPQLQSVDGEQILQKELTGWNPPHIVHAEIAHILSKCTHQSAFVEELIQDLQIKEDAYRSVVVRFLLDCGRSERLASIFEDLILADPDDMVRYHAAIGLLYCAEIINDPFSLGPSHPHRDLILGLSSDEREERIEALERYRKMIKTE